LKIFWKVPEEVFPKKSIFQIFSGKISVTALTPLFNPPKIPYIRGDPGGRGVWFEGRG
jgi:hypothetical protein